MSVCLSARMLRKYTSEPHQFFLRVACGCGSVLLWRRVIRYYFRFVDNVTFSNKITSDNEPFVGVTANTPAVRYWLRQSSTMASAKTRRVLRTRGARLRRTVALIV